VVNRSACGVHPGAHPPRLSTAAARPAPELHGGEPPAAASLAEHLYLTRRCKGAALVGTLTLMSAYQTLVVGTDGSDTSLRAVDRAAAFAAQNNAKLIIAMAHLSYVEKGDKGGWGRPARPDRVIDGRAEVALGGEGDYKVHGMSAIYAVLREARDRARAAGAKDIEARPIRGDPVHALLRLAKEVKADLLVVGNVGLSTRSDKWLGSVPGNISRRAKTDVLIVHTTD
jgi:nucleotide-binding universal stress UspA family protein